MRLKTILSGLLLLVALQSASAQDNKEHNFDVSKNLDVFTTIYKYLDMMYVDTLNANTVVGTGINAMLRSLDPYTVYYPANEVKDLKTMVTGKYAGIGAVISYNSQIKRVCINEPYEDTPAARAGLQKGDVILAIDDSSMVDKNVSYVSEHLRGDAGTSFELKVMRPTTGKTMKMTITRQSIALPAVTYYGVQPNGVGYLYLNSFTDDCSKDVRNAFIEMKQNGMKQLVLDLRNNGGGSLQEAVNIVNMFVPKGLTLVTNKGKMSRANKEYTTTHEPIDTVMPIVVLVNGETASASEITSGSLQDLDRAVIMGTRTYGKGLVQTTMDLPYNGSLKLTISKYYIPSGRCIQALKYNHARGGYTEHVPDSLTHVFYTRAGREVRDGGGIKPDVEIVPDSMPNIAYYLSSSGIDSTSVMLNWEVNYRKTHKTIGPAATFMISDAEYEDFKQAVIKSGFSYDRGSEEVMKDLVKMAKFEGYYDEAKAEFDALQNKLKHNIAKDLDYNKDLIKTLLSSDIVSMYYFQRGKSHNLLQSDKQWKEAVKLLQDPQRYASILKPNKE